MKRLLSLKSYGKTLTPCYLYHISQYFRRSPARVGPAPMSWCLDVWKPRSRPD